MPKIAEQVYHLSIIGADGRVLDFDDIFFSVRFAINEANAILRVLTRP